MMGRPVRLIALVIVCSLAVGCSAFKRFAYEGFNRDAWQHPERVIESLEIPPGALITGHARRETLAIYQHIALDGELEARYHEAMKELDL